MVNLQHFGATGQRVVLTLTENLTCGATAWSFAFLLTNALTGATCFFGAPDLTDAQGRFNEFNWQSVGATETDAENGRFYVRDAGTYDYVAYQMGPTGQSLTLTGASSAASNGTYFLTGTTTIGGTDSPVFTKSDGYYMYYQTGVPFGRWNLYSDASVLQYRSLTTGAPSVLPTLWTNVGGAGAYPPPYSTAAPEPSQTIKVLEIGRATIDGPSLTPPSYETPAQVLPTFNG